MNRLYDKGLEKFASGLISWPDDDFKLVMVDLADYTPSFSGDAFLSDIPGAARVAISNSLVDKTVTAGVCNAASPLFESVSGDACEAVVCIKDTGSAATSPILSFQDTDEDDSPMSIVPNNNNITVLLGANGVFKL